ncbi:hypothetical protein N3K66_003176 [Trichothecium roseum]|uniref:Uncharacterized protein n=1 Tax=Trichothecium roseum TaxID=47278 RepID=A0ACC0V4J5_9HYPO|nr:hypothetical protein N3K66_003176 [Trichothecium roseum]
MAVPYTSPPDSPKDPTTKKPFQATVEDASDVDLAKPIRYESNDQDSQKHEQNTSAPRSILKNKSPKPTVHFSKRPVGVRRFSEGAPVEDRRPSIPNVVVPTTEDHHGSRHGLNHRNLRRFLEAVAQKILDTYTNGSTVFDPETLFKLYTDFDLGKKEHNLLHFKGERPSAYTPEIPQVANRAIANILTRHAELFKPRDDVDTSGWVDLQVFYQSLQCEQHLVQLQTHGDPFIPALTVGGFVHFMALLVDACPSTESRRLLNVAEKLGVETFADRSPFPGVPDLKTTEKLRRVYGDWMTKRLHMMAGSLDPQASLEYGNGRGGRHSYPTPEVSPRSSRMYDYDEPYHIIVEEPRRRVRRHASPEGADMDASRSGRYAPSTGSSTTSSSRQTRARQYADRPSRPASDKWYYDSSSPTHRRSVDTTRADTGLSHPPRASGHGRRRHSEHTRDGFGFTSGEGRQHHRHREPSSSLKSRRNSDAQGSVSSFVDNLFGGRSRRGSDSRYEDGRGGHSTRYYRTR